MVLGVGLSGYATSSCSDGEAGAIVTWYGLHDGSNDIYAQRVSAAGTVQWASGGVLLSTARGNQNSPVVTSDGAGGAIMAWKDLRSGGASDIYTQNVKADGTLGGYPGADVPLGAPSSFALDPVRPNPSRGRALSVQFTLASSAAASLELLDAVGRRIAVREVGSFGAGRHVADLGGGQRLVPGLYFVRLTQGSNARVTRAVVLKQR